MELDQKIIESKIANCRTFLIASVAALTFIIMLSTTQKTNLTPETINAIYIVSTILALSVFISFVGVIAGIDLLVSDKKSYKELIRKFNLIYLFSMIISEIAILSTFIILFPVYLNQILGISILVIGIVVYFFSRYELKKITQ